MKNKKSESNKKKVISELLEKKFEGLNKISGGTACPCKSRQCIVLLCTCPPCCGSTPDRG